MDRGSEGQDTARLRAGQPGPAGGGARAGDVPPAPTNGAAAATNGPDANGADANGADVNGADANGADANGAGEAAAVQTPVQTPAPKIAIPKIAATGVLIPTHNDGANIATLLERLLEEPGVGEVVVVASGCDDDTVPIISEVAAGDPRVQLYVEPERSGKASAVNFGIACMSLPFIVVVSGDVLPEPGAIGLVVEALGRPGVGLAGGRPMPVNPEETAVGYACHLLWRLHHRLALHQPKLGEMIALRAEAVVSLPRTSVDEACFQALLESQGWTAVYVPEAIVANRGPGTVADFVKQRRQIHTGHLWLRRGQHYSVPSLHLGLLVTELWRDLVAERHRLRPRPLAFTAGAVALEAGARLLARFDYLRGRENVVWAMVTSTKGPTGGPNGLGPGHR